MSIMRLLCMNLQVIQQHFWKLAFFTWRIRTFRIHRLEGIKHPLKQHLIQLLWHFHYMSGNSNKSTQPSSVDLLLTATNAARKEITWKHNTIKLQSEYIFINSSSFTTNPPTCLAHQMSQHNQHFANTLGFERMMSQLAIWWIIWYKFT